MKTFALTNFIIFFAIIQVFGSLNWIQKPAMPTGNRDRATGFTIGNTLYVGTGNFNLSGQTDFWKFDISSLAWTQIANSPNPRHGATGFSYNGKGYVAWGTNFNPVIFYNDVLEYDPAFNSWTTKSSAPTAARYGASVFVINHKAFLVGGNFNTAVGPFSDEVWEYNIINDTWQLRAPYPGGALYYTTSFAIDNLGYTGGGGIKTGSGSYVFEDEFYRYDPVIDVWTSLAPYPGGELSGMTSVVFNQRAIVGSGNYSTGITSGNFYVFDPATAVWTPGPSLPSGMERSLAVGLTTQSSGFIATGINNGTGMNDLWELSESLGTGDIAANPIAVYFDGEAIILKGNTTINQVELYNLNGQKIGTWQNTIRVEPGDIANGVYIVNYTENQHIKASEKIYIYK